MQATDQNPLTWKKCTIKLACNKWKLSCHRYYEKDKRDDISIFSCIHRDDYRGQTFSLIPSGSHYKIVLTDKDVQETGWKLTTHTYYHKDQRDEDSIFVFFHKNDQPGQLWDLIQAQTSGQFLIQLADGDRKGWYLDAISLPINPEADKFRDHRDEGSNFVHIHKNASAAAWQIESLENNSQFKPPENQICTINLAPESTWNQTGWRMTVLNQESRDKRDEISTFAWAQKGEGACQTFVFVPFGPYYKIILADNSYNQEGWKLTAHTYYHKDQRDEVSIFAFFHKIDQPGQLWRVTPEVCPGEFRIKLAADQHEGWSLDSVPSNIEIEKNVDFRSDDSTYLYLHRESNGSVWQIKAKDDHQELKPQTEAEIAKNWTSSEEYSCIICCFNSRAFLFLPCKHFVTCEECAPRFLNIHCPLCQSMVEKLEKIYT